jgi:hypothetical protein
MARPTVPGQEAPLWVKDIPQPTQQTQRRPAADQSHPGSTQNRSLWGNQAWAEQYKGAPVWMRGILRGDQTQLGTSSQFTLGNDPNRGYWENPQRIVRYYNMIQNAPDDSQIPDWLDKEAITQAYDWMSYRNNGEPWYKWNYLPDDDPSNSLLQSLSTPPDDFLFPGEEMYRRPKPTATVSGPSLDEELYGKWDDLEGWEKLALTLISPQPGLQDRPEWSRLTAAGVQGVLAGLGGAAIGSMIAPGPGTIIGALAVGLPSAYQAYTSQEIPVLNELLAPFNWLAQGAEAGIGLTGQAIHDKSLNEIIENWPAAWRAAQLEYEQGGQNAILNTMAAISGDETAGKGETWQIQKGISEPVKVQGQIGVDAMIEARDRMAAGEDWNTVYADMVDRLGFSATINDFIGQSLLDPLQLAPYVGGKLGKTISSKLGNERLAAAFDAGKGSVAMDILPMGVQQIAEFLTGQHSSRGPLAAWQIYKDFIKTGTFPAGMTPVKASELSNFEKWAGGLTEKGMIKELDPSQTTGRGAFIRSLAELTPESRATGYITILADNLKALQSIYAGDPTLTNMQKAQGVFEVVKKMAGLTPTQAGEAGASIIGNAMTASTQGSIRGFLNSDVPRNLMSQWQMAQQAIQMLERTAKVMGLETGRILEMFETDRKAIFDQVIAKAREQGNQALVKGYESGALTPDTLYDVFKSFMGPDGQAWDFRDWLSRFNNAMVENATDFVIKRYGLKPDPAVNRFFGTLKSVQSLLLLDGSPWYVVNNGVNNAVTMAANGVFGAMTSRQADAWIARFGIEPTRLGEGLGPTEMGISSGKIREALQAGDWIDKATKTINAGRNKLGWASKASRVLEKVESKQAYVIGMRQMWSKLWRAGDGFQKIPADLATRLNKVQPGMAEKITSMVESGLSMDEIYGQMASGEIRLLTEELIDLAARDIDSTNPELGREVLHHVFTEDFQKQLEGAKTTDEVRYLIDKMEENYQEYLDAKVSQDLSTRAAEVAERVKAEGSAAALPLLEEAYRGFEDRWIEHFEETDKLFSDTDKMSYRDTAAAWAAHELAEESKWQQTKNFKVQTLAGLIRGMGLENPDTIKLLEIETGVGKKWDEFFYGYEQAADGSHLTYAQAHDNAITTTHVDGKRDLWRKYRETEYTDSAERKAAYVNTLQKVDDLSMQTREFELNAIVDQNKLMERAFQSFTGQDPAAVRAWGQARVDVIRARTELLRNFLNDIRTGDYSAKERNKKWAQFNKTYNKLSIQSIIDTDINGFVQTTNAPRETPAPERLNIEDAVKAKIQAEDTLAKADQVKAESDTKFRGTMTKRMLREQMRNVFKNATTQEIDTTIAMMDLHADRWAEANGQKPGVESRERWYADHAAAVINGLDPVEGSLLQADTQQFKAWFGDSKVVDSKGSPAVVYHGGSSIEFTAFDPSRDSGANLYGPGFYFTDAASVGSEYALKGVTEASKPGVLPVYLSIKNPLDLRNNASIKAFAEKVLPGMKSIQQTGAEGQRIVNHLEIITQTPVEKAYGWLDPKIMDTSFVSALARYAGYDGLIHTGGKLTGSAPHTVYIAFEPTQVKSAFNQGTYSITDPNILMQQGANLNQPNPGLAELAAAYGIPTASESGKPNNRRILEIMNMAGGKEGFSYKKIGEVPLERAVMVFEARRIESGETIPGLEKSVAAILESVQMDKVPGLGAQAVEKGAVKFLEDGRAVIRGYKAADVSTLVHEVGHIFRRDLAGDDLNAVAQWGGVKDGVELARLQQQFDDGTISAKDRKVYVDAEEQFARGFERYLAEDHVNIPPRMQAIFQRFAQWLKGIYGKIFKGTALDVDIKAEFEVNGQKIRIKDVYDRMFFDDDAVRVRESRSELLRTQPAGKTTTATGVTDPNVSYSFKWRLVDLSQVLTSHDIEFNPVAEYPKELQPRMRERAASRQQVTAIAQDLNADALIIDTHQIDRGAPVIGQDMAVESGNGRMMALRQAQLAYPENYTRYLSTLQEHLTELGFKEADLEGINHPVLVRERVDGTDRIAFVDEANAKSSAEMGAVESALKEAELVSEQSLARINVSEGQSIDEALRSKDNGFIVQEFIGKLPANDRAKLLDSKGQITMDGITRIKRALFARVFPGEAGQRLLKIFVESVDPTLKNAENAVFQSLGQILKADSLVRSGQRGAELLIADDLSGAVDKLINIKKTKQNVADYLAQMSFLEQTTPVEKMLVSFINDNNRSPKPLRDLISRYSDTVIKQQPPEQLSLIGDKQPGKAEIIERLVGELDKEREARGVEPATTATTQQTFEQQLTTAGINKVDTPIKRIGIGENEYTLVGKYQLAGKDVALIPAGYAKPKTVDVDGGSGLILGLSPAKDGKWVYLMNGELKTTGEVKLEGEPVLFQGKAPVGTAPAALNEGQILREAHGSTVKPLFDAFRKHAESQIKESAYSVKNIPAELQIPMKAWLGQVKSDMASVKLASMRHGEQMRDNSLLNYQRKYGIDKILDMGFPYQLFYTRTFFNWARKMIDKPGWFAMYTRWRQAQKKQEQQGLPSRLKNQMKVAAPWLPPWMGGSLYIDPLKALFPFDSYGQPIEQMLSEKNKLDRQVESVLYDKVKTGEITEAEKQQALGSKTGTIYNTAAAIAAEQIDARFQNPFDLVTMMMAPSWFYTQGKNLVEGTPEKISPLPGTRAGMALQTATAGIPVLGTLGSMIGGAMAAPERAVRKWAGLSDFGQWGDYYVDRQLANMAAEGLITADTAQRAMIERNGPAFEEAYQRVRQEQALKVPGMQGLFAIGQGASPAEIAASLPVSLFPSGILPEAELMLRDEAKEYSAAWKDYRAGNSEAIDQFFTEHPEYQARLALYDKPEERLRQFLVSEVWDKYTTLNKPQQAEIRNALGAQFNDAFLNPNTRSYDAIDANTLATWAQALGSRAPAAAGITEAALTTPQIQLTDYSPSMLKAVDVFEKERGKKYPYYRAWEQGYYAIPAEMKTERLGYLKRFPGLKLYWDWKDGYKKGHPEVADYLTRMSALYNQSTTTTTQASSSGDGLTPVAAITPPPFEFNVRSEPTSAISKTEIESISEPLMRQLLGYYMAGQKLSDGAIMELSRIAKSAGRNLSTDVYLEEVIKPYLGY